MNLVTQFLRNPACVAQWGTNEWNRFLPLARGARLLGRSYYVLVQHELLGATPERIIDQLRGALAQTKYVQTQAMRELRLVARTLRETGTSVIALKGVAYLASDLPPKQWRNLSDIDILVPEKQIENAEQALIAAGWVVHGDYDDYDRRYYHDWMHEIPPLVHRARGTEVDVHHNLTPPVSRIQIDADVLWHGALPASPASADVLVLSPVDMLLHNALHLYMNDELRGGLRDVVDFRDLLQHFETRNINIWEDLITRGEQLRCGRALYYAINTARRLAGLEVPGPVIHAVQRFAPTIVVRSLMAWLIDQALAPPRPGLYRTAFASQLLFIRSHWIRMPPLMLAGHLLHKALKRPPHPPTPDLPG